MAYAYDISEKFDPPVLVRSTTRISHSKSVVKVTGSRAVPNREPNFPPDVEKFVMLPVYARLRRPLVEERLTRLASYAETFPFNQILRGERQLGIITSGVAYQYGREVFPRASFLKLGMTHPLPQELIRRFAAGVDRVIVIEELGSFLQENIQAMGIAVSGKEFIPRFGELSPEIIARSCRVAGLLGELSTPHAEPAPELPQRPPLLCAGCPYTGLFFTLSSMGQRSALVKSRVKKVAKSNLIITGDIGCYTLGAYPPLFAMDTCACMGAGIGQALGMEKAGVSNKVVAVIGDSTFLHSGITGVVNGVYNKGEITIIILDNRTTAMTGHQNHPGTGVTARGEKTKVVELERLVRGIGVNDVKVVDAFDLKALRTSLRASLDNPELSVIIVRGDCPDLAAARPRPLVIDTEKCDQCNICLRLGCPAIQIDDGQVYIEATLCTGDTCYLCPQLCPRQAIVFRSETSTQESK